MAQLALPLMELVPEEFSSDFITRVFYPRCWKSSCPDCINYGECYDWAYYAYCLFPEVQLWHNRNHAWVKTRDRFFDSQYMDGIYPENDISVDRRFSRTLAKHVSSEELQTFWNNHVAGR